MEPDRITQQELIGLDAEVVYGANLCMVGIKGRVIDETRNTLVISAGEEKCLPKSGCTFNFTLPGGKKVRVDGQMLLGRPEDRITKGRKRRG
jgi:ribonuclease P protein subunit POP4